MKKLSLTGLIMMMMLLVVTLDAQTTPEQMSIALSNPGKPYTLKVGLLNGSIKVSSYPGKEILVDVINADKNKKETTEDAGNGMKRIFAEGGYEITAKENNNSVSINYNKHVSLVLKIPQDVKLTLSTVNEGVIEVENVKGELEINNVNGAIRLTNISGSAVATTVNGDVVATFAAADANAPMAFTTLNGNVDVSFPATVKSNLKLRSDRGEIFTDFDMTIEKPEQALSKTGSAGMQRLKMEDWIKGKINGGGPEILMKNMNGNIYVRKAKGLVN
jgi:hypothetical protein